MWGARFRSVPKSLDSATSWASSVLASVRNLTPWAAGLFADRPASTSVTSMFEGKPVPRSTPTEPSQHAQETYRRATLRSAQATVAHAISRQSVNVSSDGHMAITRIEPHALFFEESPQGFFLMARLAPRVTYCVGYFSKSLDNWFEPWPQNPIKDASAKADEPPR